VSGARKVKRKPGEVRRSKDVDPSRVEKIHVALRKLQVSLEDEPDLHSLRAQFTTIRSQRNSVTKLVGFLLPDIGALRSDLVRVDRVIDAETAMLVETGHAHGSNATERTASLKQKMREWHDARADIRADLHLLEEAVSHAKWVRDELRFAFEEASRSLASIELEYRIERSAP